MEELPFELQNEILQYLDSSNAIKAVRLLNRNFHFLATPHLFRQVFVSVGTASLARLNRISVSSLSQYVRCVHYNIWVPPYITRPHWNRGEDRVWSNGPSARLMQCWDCFAYYRIQDMPDEYSLFKKAFQGLLAVRSLEISERQPSSLPQPEELQAVCHIAEPSDGDHPYRPLERRPLGSNQISRPVAMVSAYGEVRHGMLQSLTFENFRWGWFDVDGVRMYHEPSSLSQALRGLRRLRILAPKNLSRHGENNDDDADVAGVRVAVETWKRLIEYVGDFVEIRTVSSGGLDIIR